MMLVIIFILGYSSFLMPRDAVAEVTSDTLIPSLFYKDTWKISNADGPADWSPREDILVVSTSGFEPRVMLYGANGTKLMTIAEFRQGEFISTARFNPNGSKIAFTHTMPPDSSSQLEIFDLKTKATQNFQFQGNFTEFDWMPDGNHIIYLMFEPNSVESGLLAYQIRIHDLRTGSETVLDSVTNVQYFDLSQDGTTLLLVRQVIGQQPCQINIDGNCYGDEIVTLKLGQNNRDNSTDSAGVQADNNPYVISSKVIWKQAYSIAFPRWVMNDSAIVYSVGYYRCGGPLVAISPDGTRNQTLLSSTNEGHVNGACYERGGVLNRDGTIMAHVINSGIQASGIDFNPINSGLYLTFTEICNSKPCTIPSNTIPIVEGPVSGVAQPISQYGNPQYNLFLSVGYEAITDGPKIDENTKTLSMTLQGPRAGDRIGERDVMLYLPSSLIDGDMAIFINGTQLYPTEESKDCLTTQTEEFCSKIKADIDKIEGWSIVNITDDTTDHRSAVLIEIVGTTVTPEFGSSIATAIAALTIGSLLVAAKYKRFSLSRPNC
ncbi:TolB family protein [Nitrososphaera viennensis]|uniref:Uncharacterized protein n=1 Tax=Nitrososphaera viennensis TaxID=1034015 RepID=A0A977NKJ2_9ARCH|nr:hypothetical protein [Nitrososphaera viennensis]UVS67759.1 hypothetical protein NWT39_07530 [Nitrososphaera viennensis]